MRHERNRHVVVGLMRPLIVRASRMLACLAFCTVIVVGNVRALAFTLTPAEIHSAIAAAGDNFRRITQGPPQSPPGPYGGAYYLTSLSGCTVIENNSHRMLTCRITEKRTDYRAVPVAALVHEFQRVQAVLRGWLPEYRSILARCMQSNSLRTTFARQPSDPIVEIQGTAATGGYAIDLYVIPAGGSRVSFTLRGADAVPDRAQCM